MKDTKGLPEPVTLDEIRKAKFEKLEQIREKQASIASISRQIMAPVSDMAHSGRALTKSVGTGMAILQGAITGIQMIRKIQRIFGRRR